ncbi:MAG: phosphatidylserine decarboxylase [Xenococcaceae cyanobacterium]
MSQEFKPIVQKLVNLIKENNWEADFEQAIKNAYAKGVQKPVIVQSIQSLDNYLNYINDLLTWIPRQHGESRNVYDMIVAFYFYLDELMKLQSPIRPDNPLEPPQTAENLTPLSEWMVEYANAWGSYMDTPESAEAVETFRTDPWFNWDDYMAPPSGYLTFNQFFARHVKPGARPIAGLSNNSVIVSPADCTPAAQAEINEDSKINVKGIVWSIEQLLEGSIYKDRFKGGLFAHAFLNSIDYHRWHSPVQGRVLEVKVIQGQVYLDVQVKTEIVNGQEVKSLNALDGTGYQFVQTRGLIVLDSPIGLVACLPMGMAQVSSVIFTAEEGVTLHKGEEMGYFQFGGSDFVMVFERASNVRLTWPYSNTFGGELHFKQGTCIGNAYPYTMS